MATGRVPTTANSPLTAKGDLFGYSTTQARVPVGNDGETLVADSSATTGLRWQGNFAAGKNKIINGDFRINQRSFTSNTTEGSFNFDRWLQFNGGTSGTLTVTPQTFTAGAAPVAGYEAINFVRNVTASGASVDTYAIQTQKVEDVRTFAGQTVTLSFWAKAASGTPSIGIELAQAFGSGGSAQVNTAGGAIAITTSWARYSTTVTLPSISGKTIGTGSTLNVNFWLSAGSNSATRASSIGLQNNTFDLWGVQLEAGNVATAFQTATGTLAGELAACQRYYFKTTVGRQGVGFARTTTTTSILTFFPVEMRIAPTALEQSGTAADYLVTYLTSANACSAVPVFSTGNKNNAESVYTVGSGLTAGHGVVAGSNSANSYLAWSAEL